jgi:hypothetical protein
MHRERGERETTPTRYERAPVTSRAAFLFLPFSPVRVPGGLSEFAAQVGCEQRLSQ